MCSRVPNDSAFSLFFSSNKPYVCLSHTACGAGTLTAFCPVLRSSLSMWECEPQQHIHHLTSHCLSVPCLSWQRAFLLCFCVRTSKPVPPSKYQLQAPSSVSLTLTLPVRLIRGCVGKRLDRRHSPLFFVSSSALTIGSGWGAESRYSQPATRALEGWYGQAKLTVAVRWV